MRVSRVWWGVFIIGVIAALVVLGATAKVPAPWIVRLRLGMIAFAFSSVAFGLVGLGVLPGALERFFQLSSLRVPADARKRIAFMLRGVSLLVGIGLGATTLPSLARDVFMVSARDSFREIEGVVQRIDNPPFGIMLVHQQVWLKTRGESEPIDGYFFAGMGVEEGDSIIVTLLERSHIALQVRHSNEVRN